MPRKKSNLKNNLKYPLEFFFVVILVLLVLVLFLSWYIFDKQGGQSDHLDCSQDFQTGEVLDGDNKEEFLDLSNTDPEVGGILQRVSEHILLPAEEFTVATVKDAVTMKQQSPVLFQYIQNGHKMLMYSTGVIVYDTELDKIVDVIQFYPFRLQSGQTGQ